MLIVLGFVYSAVIIERPSAASAAAAVQAQIPDPVRPLPSLQSLTFYEQSTGIGSLRYFDRQEGRKGDSPRSNGKATGEKIRRCAFK